MTDELQRRSLRMLVDMQACQTLSSGRRGVGRFSREFLLNLTRVAQQHEIFAYFGDQASGNVKLDGLMESRVIRFPPLPAWNTNRDFLGGEQDTLDALSLSAYLAPLNADIIHVSHVFEGYGERIALPSFQQRAAGQIISATLYDLIPLLFQDHYFQDENYKKWYLSRVAWLQQADMLLAISESSRQDAIDLLGIEPWRIVTVHGGISPHFTPPSDRQEVRRKIASEYNLRERVILYAGGDDHRKNIRGAIKGYATIPPELRNNCQLVIVCAMTEDRKQMYMNDAQAFGLLSDEVKITGFVPEKDLAALYGTCDLFVFPSLYEGLGLPVLEAMACGAPVIGGSNSSIKEIIARSDALFDAESPESIGGAIAKAIGDPDYTAELREYGMQRSKEFTWQHTAEKAIEAFNEASRRSREFGVQSATQGWLPKKRLAMFTPLPPCRSGIADYNAQFLPYLARHFEIDLYVDNYKVVNEQLTSTFRIFSAKDFGHLAAKYDAILYEFGNSEFHAYMLPLLEQYPGIVGLHDAYLSGFFSYMESLNTGISYTHEMLTAHGTRAKRYFAPVQKHPNPAEETMVRFPCTKRILDHAIGVISHSPFNLKVAQDYFPEGWQAPYRIIPQMIPLQQPWSVDQRSAARTQLGFQADDFIITTFGHIVWTKKGDQILKAILESSLLTDKQVHFVFAGELLRDNFGRSLMETIKASGLKDKVTITGFLSEQDYERYLQITDLAIQLRSNSRGGTPKSVLDCLAHGVPVIVNNDASFTDYPDDVVIKVSAEPLIQEISQTLELFRSDYYRRKAFIDHGLDYVKKHHDPAACAAGYAGAIHEFIDRHNRMKVERQISLLAPHLAGCQSPDEAVNAAVNWLNAIPDFSFKKRRLFIDVSHIAQTDLKTGIQRVVREIVRELYCSEKMVDIEPVAVELIAGSLHIAVNWLLAQGLVLPVEAEYMKKQSPIDFRPGDILLMLDSSWWRYREFYPTFEQARASHVPVYTVIYDLLPITLPSGNIVDGGKEWFGGWVRDAAQSSDGIICISETVATEVKDYTDSIGTITNRPQFGYWHLGADFNDEIIPGMPSQSAMEISTRSYLLMVGTIEPRKNHALALSVMESLWAQGYDLDLCIAGKEGWMVEELMKCLRNHPLLGKRLFLFENPSDVDLRKLYENAAGLLFLSKGEGFGLPLIEAAHYGTPIVCSDIPVFREISGNYATYVNISNEEELKKDLLAWWSKKQARQLPDTRLMPRLTWEQSAHMLWQVIETLNRSSQ